MKTAELRLRREKRCVRVGAAIKPSLKDWIDEAAAQSSRTTSKYIEDMLMRARKCGMRHREKAE